MEERLTAEGHGKAAVRVTAQNLLKGNLVDHPGIKVCLIKNGYPPQYSPEVFRKVMEQVENFEENS